MKKIYTYLLGFVFLIILAGCGSTAVSEKPMSFDTSVASMSYISSSFVEAEMSMVEETPDTYSVMFLSNVVSNQPETTTSFEGELEWVNVYLDKLKGFMGEGLNSIDVSTDTVSDNEEYSFMFSYTVEGETYTIYYNIDPDTEDVSGILISGDYEYALTIEDNTTSEDGEEKTNLKLSATSEDNYINIHYRTVAEEGETKELLSIDKSVEGNVSELEIEVKEDTDGTFIVKIDDGANSYKFKQSEEDGETTYKLDYEVDGVKGFVLIHERTDDDGELYYQYKIHENGVTKDVDKGKPEKDNPSNNQNDEEEENEEEDEKENNGKNDDKDKDKDKDEDETDT